MNIYIPEIDFNTVDKRRLFIATRPFYMQSAWGNDETQKNKWDTTDTFTSDINDAHALFIPKPINDCTNTELKEFDALCAKHNMFGFGQIVGDYGVVFKPFDNLFYFRSGGFKKQLPKNNIGLPMALSDIYQSLYKNKPFETRSKNEVPTIGFCGHANKSISKKIRDELSFVKKNLLRFINNPLRKDYEPLFASAYQRYQLLNTLENASLIKANFIYRKNYRAGAFTKASRKKTNKEYYENMRQSDYVLCIRGAGNFSVRLNETLMMGRIPVFIDTDCLLPFEDEIEWEKHMVWVPWENRNRVGEILSDFHNKLSTEEFVAIQIANRTLWENKLSVAGTFDYIRRKSI